MNPEQTETVKQRNFYLRSEDEQADFLTQTWCNDCMEMDLGMLDPQEFESESKVWIEGSCKRCGAKVVTEIQEEDDDAL